MAAEGDRQKAWIFFSFTWASYCLLQKQWTRSLVVERPISGFIRVPMQWICISLVFDNLRLFFGAALGKEGASITLGHVTLFMRVIGRGLSLSVMAAAFGSLIGWPWLRYVGGAAAVFYGINGLNYYVSSVHGRLVYREDGGVARYTIDKGSKPDQVAPPTLPLPASVLAAGFLLVTCVAMTTAGDVIPLFIQAVVTFSDVVMTSMAEKNLVYSTLFRMLSIANLLRMERYV